MSNFDIYYKKNDNSELFSYLSEKSENKIKNIKNYIPIYSRFFSLNDTNYNKINLNQKYNIHNIKNDIDENSYNVLLFDCSKNNIAKKSFFKFSPLLNVTKYLAGKYKDVSENKIKNLPKLNSCDDILNKIECCNNCAYTDSFFSYLSSQLLHNHKFSHGLDFYGSFLGIKEKFKTDITDDLEYLYDYKFFHDNQNILFDTDIIDETMLDDDTRKNRTKIKIKGKKELNIECINNEIYDDVFENLTIYNLKKFNNNMNLNDISLNNIDYLRNIKKEDDLDDNKTNSECSSRVSDTDADDNDSNNDSNNDSISEFDSDVSEYSSIDEGINAYIYNFPCQIICLEKMDTTLDECVENEDFELSRKEWLSCLFQIIMILVTYQKAFNFTHNDLHTNNIMFNNTEKKYMYYYYLGKYWKVPTYGKLYKIIDYGRAIYSFKGKELISDCFFKTGDAAGQYNFSIFKNTNKSELKPNFGFDLCRLGCSLFDYFIPDINEKITNPIAQLINEWVCDDNGKNLLYKSNGEERYPDFKLYKMIVRKSTKHTPENQLNKHIFKQFISSKRKIGKKAPIIDIDKIPKYF